jgi:hypothetical protein
MHDAVAPRIDVVEGEPHWRQNPHQQRRHLLTSASRKPTRPYAMNMPGSVDSPPSRHRSSRRRGGNRRIHSLRGGFCGWFQKSPLSTVDAERKPSKVGVRFIRQGLFWHPLCYSLWSAHIWNSGGTDYHFYKPYSLGFVKIINVWYKLLKCINSQALHVQLWSKVS